jgi:hypothetical protein
MMAMDWAVRYYSYVVPYAVTHVYKTVLPTHYNARYILFLSTIAITRYCSSDFM